MSALDFPNAPVNGQQFNASNGAMYVWDGTVWKVATATGSPVVISATPPASPVVGQMWWRNDPDGNMYVYYDDGNSKQFVPATATTSGPWSVSGATLTPTDATKNVTIVGPATGTTLLVGSSGGKARLQQNPTGAQLALTLNRDWLSANAQDDATKPSWGIQIRDDIDSLVMQRSAAGVTAQTTLLTLDNGGILSVPGSLGSGVSYIMGLSSRTIKARLQQNITTDNVGLCINVWHNGSAWVRDDTSKPGYFMDTNLANDTWYVSRMSAAGAWTTQIQVNAAGDLIIAGSNATKTAGTAWINPSDRRIKDDIIDYTTGLKAILGLRPRAFVYNGKGGSRAGLEGYGYVADEAAKVMPEMLSVMRGKLNADDDEDTDIQTLDTSNVTLALVNAVKELATRVSALEGR